MKLQYRGISYDHNPTALAVTENVVRGKFRGHEWAARNLTQVSTAKPSAHLVYRGVVVK